MPGLDVLDAVAGGELNVVERHYQFLVIVGDEPEWRILAFNGGFVNKHVGGLHIKAVVVLYCHKIYFLVFYCAYIHAVAGGYQLQIHQIFKHISYAVAIAAIQVVLKCQVVGIVFILSRYHSTASYVVAQCAVNEVCRLDIVDVGGSGVVGHFAPAAFHIVHDIAYRQQA